MMSPEIVFDYSELLWFQPVTGDYVELDHWAPADAPLPVSDHGLALVIPTNMSGGPIRFRLLIDVDESMAAAELGPHDRRPATEVFHSNGSAYGLMDVDGDSIVLTTMLPAGDYQAVLLRAGINETMFDGLYDESDERYWLLLTSVPRA